jgi:hypothetical protein
MSYSAGPFDSPHLYVQWGGKLPGPEQWSCGLRLRKKTAGAIDSGAGLLVGISGAIATFHASADAQISAAAKLSFVKVNAVGTDGRYSGAGTNQALYADTPGAGAAIQKYPNQIAWAVTLTTGFTRGPAHKGRFYLPLPDCYIAGTDGRVSTAAAETLHGAVATLIGAINTVNADYEVAVFSRKSGAAGNRKVTGNAVGRTLDTQRRRRRSQVEDYQS